MRSPQARTKSHRRSAVRRLSVVAIALVLTACGTTGPVANPASGPAVAVDVPSSATAPAATVTSTETTTSTTTSAPSESAPSGSATVESSGGGASVEPLGEFDPRAIDPLATPTPILPVTVTGADGVESTVTSVERVVAVSQSGTVAEIVATLGLADTLAGRDIAATFLGTEDVPIVTQGHDLATEPVLALDPTLVLLDESAGPPEVIAQLRGAGIPVVVVPDAWTLEDIGPRIAAVASAMGVPDAGQELLDRTEDQIAAAAALRPEGEKPPRIAFLYLRGTAGVYLMAGEGSGADSMIEAIGAEDAGTAMGLEKFRPITSEGMILAAPDVLLLMTKGYESVGGMEGLLKIPGIAQTPAAQNQRVVTMDDGILLSFGPRTGEVITHLAAEVYGAGS